MSLGMLFPGLSLLGVVPAISLSATSASSTQINLSWNPTGGTSASYSIFRGVGSATPTLLTTVTTTSFSDTGLTASTSYSYYITGTIGGQAVQSNTATATTPAAGTGALISVSGNKFVNSSAVAVQLRGGNMSGLEFTAVQGNQQSDGWGGTVPNWSLYQTWKPNVARIPLNAASFLELTTFDGAGTSSAPAWGASRNCDPTGLYKTYLKTAIDAARAIGCYVILDLHWTAPQFTFSGVTHQLSPRGQSPFIDNGIGLTFWTDPVNSLPAWLIATYGAANISDIIFELFNEPFLDDNGGTFSAGSSDQALLNGGTATVYNALNYSINAGSQSTWTLAGYQQVLNGIRALGCKNICIINGNSFTQNLQHRTTWFPTDTLNPPQLAAGWHPYPAETTSNYNDGNIYPRIGTDSGANSTSAIQWAVATLSAGVPVIETEDGDNWSGNASGSQATGASSAQHIAYMQQQADSHGWSIVGWQWNNAQPTSGSSFNPNLSPFMTQATSPVTPTVGYGVQMNTWMVNHP